MKKIVVVFAFFFSALLIYSCQKDPTAPSQREILEDENASLGRVLFYDRHLSADNSISCASCHKQELAFSDDVDFSTGISGQKTDRNSLPIQNVQDPDRINVFRTSPPPNGLESHLFWDGRETDLGLMLLRPIANHKEMGVIDMEDLCNKLEELPYYTNLFAEQFGDAEITVERISMALKEFIVSITSENTKFDRVNPTFFAPTPIPSGEKFTELESFGNSLFQGKYNCNGCHQVQSPNGYIFAGTFANIGLDANPTDIGVGGITGDPTDVGLFKIPSLRNVVLTAPYMHDGRFNTLEEVIDHYSHGIQANPNLSFLLQEDFLTGQPKVFNISDHEKRALVAFLHTLTDYDMIANPQFSNPFKTVSL